MKGGGWRRETRDQSRNQEARGLGPQISQICADFFWGREGSYPLSVIRGEEERRTLLRQPTSLRGAMWVKRQREGRQRNVEFGMGSGAGNVGGWGCEAGWKPTLLFDYTGMVVWRMTLLAVAVRGKVPRGRRRKSPGR